MIHHPLKISMADLPLCSPAVILPLSLRLSLFSSLSYTLTIAQCSRPCVLYIPWPEWLQVVGALIGDLKFQHGFSH